MITYTYGFLRTLGVLFEHEIDVRGQLWMSWIEPLVRLLYASLCSFLLRRLVVRLRQHVVHHHIHELVRSHTSMPRFRPDQFLVRRLQYRVIALGQ
jgi:hypothetical protein